MPKVLVTRSKKKVLPPDFEPRRSTRPRKVVSTKGTCGAPAARVALGNVVPTILRKPATACAAPIAVQATQSSSINFREDVGSENYVEVTIRGNAMDNETVRIFCFSNTVSYTCLVVFGLSQRWAPCTRAANAWTVHSVKIALMFTMKTSRGLYVQSVS